MGTAGEWGTLSVPSLEGVVLFCPTSVALWPAIRSFSRKPEIRVFMGNFVYLKCWQQIHIF